MSSLYKHDPHPRIAERKTRRSCQGQRATALRRALHRFNNRFALVITIAVGSMWCAR